MNDTFRVYAIDSVHKKALALLWIHLACFLPCTGNRQGAQTKRLTSLNNMPKGGLMSQLKNTRMPKRLAAVNPLDGVQLELAFDHLEQSSNQTAVIRLEVMVRTGFSGKKWLTLPSSKPVAMIVLFGQNAPLFLRLPLGSLPSGWDRDKNGARLRGWAMRSRLWKLARENGWFDFWLR